MSLAPHPSQTGNILIYDEECFFCSNYIRLLNLRASIGDITLINARDAEKVRALHLLPADLNEGMVLLLGEQRYFGADAVHHLAMLSTSVTWFNKINRMIFRTRGLAQLLYPLLKFGRRIYLAVTGKGQIQ
jgi:predicted DCC family thiol-disulfide oxidoreductase YuxK